MTRYLLYSASAHGLALVFLLFLSVSSKPPKPYYGFNFVGGGNGNNIGNDGAKREEVGYCLYEWCHKLEVYHVDVGSGQLVFCASVDGDCTPTSREPSLKIHVG